MGGVSVGSACAEIDLQLVRDPRGFVRRACPSCGRHFKVRGGGGEDALVHSAITGAVPHANAGELPPAAHRACPYCGHTALADAFLTPIQRGWVEKWSKSLASEVRVTQLRQLAQRLDDNPYLTFVVVPPTAPPDRLPAEPDDMRTVAVWCCDDEVKLKRTWREPFYCPQCRTRHAPVGGRQAPESSMLAAGPVDRAASA
jgi:hypothetical protein